MCTKFIPKWKRGNIDTPSHIICLSPSPSTSWHHTPLPLDVQPWECLQRYQKLSVLRLHYTMALITSLIQYGSGLLFCSFGPLNTSIVKTLPSALSSYRIRFLNNHCMLPGDDEVHALYDSTSLKTYFWCTRLSSAVSIFYQIHISLQIQLFHNKCWVKCNIQFYFLNLLYSY